MKYFYLSMHLGKFRLAYKVFLPVITNLLRFVERSPGMVVVRHIGRLHGIASLELIQCCTKLLDWRIVGILEMI